MFLRDGDVVYWNDPSGKRSQSGVIISQQGRQYKLMLGDGECIQADINQLEVM